VALTAIFVEEGNCTSEIKTGGAITAGFLAYKWDELEFDEIDGTTGKVVATNFEEKITKPLVKFCNANIDIPCALTGLISLKSSIGDKIEKKYDELLFNKTLLSNVANRPGAPEFIYYGTNYDTGVSVRITKEYFLDYRIGRATAHDISIAQAVCVSSSFLHFFRLSYWMVLHGGGKRLSIQIFIMSKNYVRDYHFVMEGSMTSWA